MVRTQEVRDSRVMESHAELQQEQEQEQGTRREKKKGRGGRVCTVVSDGQDSRSQR